VLKRTRKTKILPLRFYPFFAPQFFLKKEKANFVFAVAEWSEAMARSITTCSARKIKFRATTRAARGKLRASLEMGSRKG
jgi:hypothetical protein